MELVNISSKYVALLKSKRSKTKKVNGLACLRKALTTQAGIGVVTKILLDNSKSVYPYEYINLWETKLRPKNAFCRKLNIKGISDQDYKHAQQVWNSMKKKTLSRYHDTH